MTLVRPQPDGQVVVLDSNPHDFDASLSPDGSKVVFARAVPQTYQGAWPSDLFVVNTDGSGLKQVASGNGSELVAPTFSPDGSWIAYSCMPSGQSGAKNGSVGCGPLPDGTHRAAATVLMTADGSDKRVILLDPTAHFLSWSADGKWIATESVGPCTCSDGSTRNTNIFAYHTDGSDLFNDGDPSRQVTHEKDSRGADFGQFLMASSGELVYYRPVDDSGGAAGYDYTILVDGTHRRELPLSDQGLHYGVAIPDATGAGPPPFVNVTRVRVPAVRALSYRAARHRLQAAHLRVGIIHRRYSSRTPRNHVLRQYPRGGTYAHRSNVRGPRVNLTLSRGARK